MAPFRIRHAFLKLAFHAFLALAWAAAAHAAETALPRAVDLAQDGASVAKTGGVIVLMVSLKGCPQCEVVRRSHLLPLQKSAQNQKVLLRQIELNGANVATDFSGVKTTHAEIARRLPATLAPSVFFLDAKGQAIAEPLIGTSIPDFYGAYFDEALQKALNAAARR